MRGVAPPRMPLGGSVGKVDKVDRRWAGRSQGALGGRAPSGVSTQEPSWTGTGGAEKEEPTELILSTLAPRFMVRCADYIRVLAINVFQIGAVIHRCWGQGGLVVPPRRLLLQQTRNTRRPHFWWPWDASIGPLSCAQASHPCLIVICRVQRVCSCSRQELSVYISTYCLHTYIAGRPVRPRSICMT